MRCSALSLLTIVRYSPPTSGPTLGEANCRAVVKDPPNAVLPDLFWYGYRSAKPLPFRVRRCRALTDHVDWRFLTVFPTPGQCGELALPILCWNSLRSQCPVISSTASLSCHLPRESSFPLPRSPIISHRALDLLRLSVASH